MNRRKKIVDVLFAVVIILAVEALACATDDLQPSVPENDYVLRSCMSSVQLSRRNVDSPKSKPHPSPHGPRRRFATPAMPYPASRYSAKSMETRTRGTSQQKPEERMLRRGRPGRQMIADTPLTTLKVERRGRKDAPQLYVKNDLLPEIESSVGDRRQNKTVEASIIVIGSAPRLSSN